MFYQILENDSFGCVFWPSVYGKLGLCTFLKNWEVILSKSSVCTKPFQSECFLVLPTCLYLVGFLRFWCCLVMLSDCDQWATVWVMTSEMSVFQTWSLFLCASAIMNTENYAGDAFKHWKDGVVFKFHFSLCASVMTVHLYILCLLRNKCLSF